MRLKKKIYGRLTFIAGRMNLHNLIMESISKKMNEMAEDIKEIKKQLSDIV